MKKCPFCAEEIQEEAIKCKHCGEMLVTETPGKSPVDVKSYKKSILLILGVVILAIGINVTWRYYNMDTTVAVKKYIEGKSIAGIIITPGQEVEERVNNMGLMHERQVGTMIGIAMIIAGGALFVVGWLLPGKLSGLAEPVEPGHPRVIVEPVRNEGPNYFQRLSAENKMWAYIVLGFITLLLLIYVGAVVFRSFQS